MRADDLIFTTAKDQLTAVNPKNQQWLTSQGPGPNFDQSSGVAGKVVVAIGLGLLVWALTYLVPWIFGTDPPEPPPANDIRGFQGFFLLGAAAFVLFFGIWQVRFSRSNTDLGIAATHVIGGRVGPPRRGPNGRVTMFTWQAQSPASGQELRGNLQFGRLNKRHGRIREGMIIPVLWKSDRELSPL